MKGVTFVGDRRIEYLEVSDPTPGIDEVIVEIKASGICGSDLHVYRAPFDPEMRSEERIIGGHEPAGIIAAVGAAVPPSVAKVGDRVMVHHYFGCSMCSQCRTGWPQLCDPRYRRTYSANAHGAHAPLMRVRAATLIPLNDGLSFEAGAAISCGTGTAWGALERLQLRGGQTVAVFGQGPVGVSVTMLAAAQGARVIAIDLDDDRLALSRSFGAQHAINAKAVDPVQAILEITRGIGVSAAIETSGSPQAAQSGLQVLSVWGTICLVGLGSKLTLETKALLDRQVTAMTSYTVSTVGQMRCADFVVERALNLDKLFTHRWKLEEAEAAYQMFDAQSSGKGVFVFD